MIEVEKWMTGSGMKVNGDEDTDNI